MSEGYERFEAWRAARLLVAEVYRATAAWPASERFGLTAQARRAAVSVAVNIAEGATRRGAREFRRFLDQARGSHSELRCLLQLAGDIGLRANEPNCEFEEHLDTAGRLLWGLYASMSAAAKR